MLRKHKENKEYVYFVNINNKPYPVKVIVKKVKRIQLRIKNQDLLISSPHKLSESYVDMLIQKYESFIIKHITNNSNNSLLDDEYILFGEKHKKNNMTEEELKSIYKNSLKTLENYFYEIQSKYHFRKCDLYIHKMKSRWGVCYPSKNKIGLSSYLIYVPFHLIEYVIIHEFCHFEVLNHSKLFYNNVGKFFPNYKEARKELKNYSVYFDK